MFHLNRGMKVEKFLLIQMASYAPYITCESLYILIWINFGLSQVRTPSRKVVPLHKSIEVLESGVIKILPTAHAFTCCDSTSKVATKSFTAGKVSVFGVFLVRIFRHSGWIRRDIWFECEKIRTRKTPNTDTFDTLFSTGCCNGQ